MSIDVVGQLLERFPTGLRVSQSGYSLKTGWGDQKRIVAAVHGGELQTFIDDACLIVDALEVLAKLNVFFREVAELTAHHRVDDDGERAWVAPSDLGAALEKVDPNWFNCPSSSAGGAPDS